MNKYFVIAALSVLTQKWLTFPNASQQLNKN